MSKKIIWLIVVILVLLGIAIPIIKDFLLNNLLKVIGVIIILIILVKIIVWVISKIHSPRL